MKNDKQNRKPFLFLVALPTAAVVLSAVFLAFWFAGVGLAAAAEKATDVVRLPVTFVPEPTRQPQPQPLLAEGEVLRPSTRFAGRTESLLVAPGTLHRGLLILVSFRNPLPEDYVPVDLEVANAMIDPSGPTGLIAAWADMRVNAAAGEQLLAMTHAAWAEDDVVGFRLQSSYRSFNEQTYLHRARIQELRNRGYGEAEATRIAETSVARPRHSEHHTGLAIDLSSRSHPHLAASYADTVNGQWLAAHSWRFGFVVRYPEDRAETTGIIFEPWHLRYVGRPHSDIIHMKDWVLEEYLAFLEAEGGCTFRDEDGAIWQIDYHAMGEGVIRAPAELPYAISGDGLQGIIITTRME